MKFLPVIALGLLLHAAHAAPAKALGNDYLSRLRATADGWKTELPLLEKSASAAADKVMAGGHLYIGGPQKSFVEEASGRSGGLMLAKPLRAAAELQPNDVILAGATRTDGAEELAALFQRAEASHAQVILFSDTRPPGQKQVTVFSATGKSAPEVRLPGVESVSNVIGMWAWTGEFVTACIKRGKMPCMFESTMMPGGKDRDALLRPLPFHSHNVPHPEAVPDLGRAYLETASGALQQVAEKNGAAFDRGAALLKTSRDQNQPVSVMAIAHMFPVEMASNPLPAFISAAPKNVPPPGALVLYLGYQWFPWEIPVLTGPERGPSIITSSRHPTPDWLQDASHVYIDPCWETPDAVVKVPGYDISILPVSGVIQSAIFWELVEKTGSRQ